MIDLDPAELHEWEQLCDRIKKVEALRDGAKTPGERAAATKALERLHVKFRAAQKRLAELEAQAQAERKAAWAAAQKAARTAPPRWRKPPMSAGEARAFSWAAAASVVVMIGIRLGAAPDVNAQRSPTAQEQRVKTTTVRVVPPPRADWRVQAPDGRIIEFPGAMTEAQVAAVMRRLYPPPPTAAPEPLSRPARTREEQMQAIRDAAIPNLTQAIEDAAILRVWR